MRGVARNLAPPGRSRFYVQAANSLKFFHECAVVSNVLPEAFEDGADVVADGKFVIELTGGSSMFHIYKKDQKKTTFDYFS